MVALSPWIEKTPIDPQSFHELYKRDPAETAVIFVLIVAIIGELITFVLIAQFYGYLDALLFAPVGGVFAALAAGVFLSLKA